MRKLLCLAVFLIAVAPSQAITRRDNLTEQQTIDLASSLSVFSAVGRNGGGSGTLISSEWVLTAAHVGSPSAFVLNGVSYPVAQAIPHPSYNGVIENGFDIALLRLGTPVTSVAPAPLYTGTSELGKVGYHVGFGYRGTGSGGHTGEGFGVKRACQNIAEILGGQVPVGGGTVFSNDYLVADFDSPANLPTRLSGFGSSDVPLAFEGSIAPGDSGGGFFIQDDDGAWKLAGVHSWIDGILPGGDGSDNASYTDLLASTRVSDYTAWIAATAVPEPATLPLTLLGVAAIGLFRRKKP